MAVRQRVYALAIRLGTKYFGDGDSWVEWMLFPRMTDLEAKDIIEDVGWHHFYDGPGLKFANQPGIRHSRSYTLITRRGGYDV